MTRILPRRAVWLAVLISVAACGGGGDDDEISGDLADSTPDTGTDAAPDVTPDAGAAPSGTVAAPPPTTEPPPPTPTEPPPPATTTSTTSPELAPGELLELMSFDSPAEGMFLTGIHSFDRLTVIQFSIRGPVFVVEWANPAVGLRRSPTSTALTKFAEVNLPTADECPDPDGTGCGNTVAGFDPTGCVLVHDTAGVLHCYDITDPENPVDQWTSPMILCPDGMLEKVAYSQFCDAGPVVDVEGLRVMLQPAGRLTVFNDQGELVCQQLSTNFRYSLHEIPPDHAAYEEGHVLLQRESAGESPPGTSDVLRYDLETCERSDYNGELPELTPPGVSTVEITDENGVEATWSLSSNQSYQVTVNGPNGFSLPLGEVAPWARPKLITDGSAVYAVLTDPDGKVTLHRVDNEVDEILEDLPEISDAAFNGLGQLILARADSKISLYTIG